MVHVIDRAPGRCRVTAVARFRRCDVARRFHRGQNGADLRMAADTGRIRALKDAARVAAVAGYILVCTVQFETGGVVVE